MSTKEEIIKNSPYKPYLRKVIYQKNETADSVTIRLDWKLKHEPGQFVFCSIPGIGEAPISICSYSDKYVELNIHQVGNVTNALSKIKKGNALMVRGAYGKSYPMDQFKGNNIVIIGGGVGVAPLKGIIEYIEKQRKDFGDISLFFGFRTPDDVLFEKDMARWQKNFKLHISFDKVGTKTTFNGKQGFVTQLVDKNIQDSNNTVVFLCGPPIMIEKTIEILLNKGFDGNQLYLSAERLMYCGVGKCGRCMIHGKYTCLDGAVFKYSELKDFKDD
ncbi:MAG: FAD/NAD(P)-binding protein [Nanoarchaeota archaeon]|nr:FAD/NAD(P)-binding protein [Nanoarchaeota archaeon]